MKSKLLATVVITAAGLVATPAGVGLAAMNHPPHAERLNAASTVRHTRVRQARRPPAVLPSVRPPGLSGRTKTPSTRPTGISVDQAFARFGPRVVACAHGVANRESGHWPYSDNGTHHGTFQLGQGFWGSIVAAASTLGTRTASGTTRGSTRCRCRPAVGLVGLAGPTSASGR